DDADAWELLFQDLASGAPAATDIEDESGRFADKARDLYARVIVILRIVGDFGAEMRLPDVTHDPQVLDQHSDTVDWVEHTIVINSLCDSLTKQNAQSQRAWGPCQGSESNPQVCRIKSKRDVGQMPSRRRRTAESKPLYCRENLLAVARHLHGTPFATELPIGT